jgi:hypothetical protein
MIVSTGGITFECKTVNVVGVIDERVAITTVKIKEGLALLRRKKYFYVRL